MPYWANFWNACLILADEVARWEPPSQAEGPKPTVLELGCGLGLVSLVALDRGYDVIASDYDDDALAFVAENARRNGLPPPITRFVDWREFYPDLELDRIVAAEVLYEPRNLMPIAQFIRNHLKPGGQAWIVDQNRSTADPFEEIAHRCGLAVECRSCERPVPEIGRSVAGRIFQIRHADSPATGK
ncbi:MAG: class I SAM-dependent methyltransferase [Planctomycetes bacterium]|nr:class I SAM-dependent methyltransferase [Planctomycetota bacterium]